MPLLLIGVRENRWYKEPAQAWLDRGDVPADPIGDLRTTGNQLSVWEILPDRSNLHRVIRALAVGKPDLDHSGWVLFESALLPEAGVRPPKEIPGQTKDKGANHWHRDLVDLSGNQLVALTKTVIEHGETGTVLRNDLLALVEAGIKANELQENELPEKIRDRIKKQREKVAEPQRG